MWWYHHNNHNHKNNNNNMWYSLRFKTTSKTTNVISTPRRRLTQQQMQITNNKSSDVFFTIFYQSVMWWCLLSCSIFMEVVSGTPVIRIQKDLESGTTTTVTLNNTDLSSNLGCMYKGNVFSHRSHVATEKPCLNCTCSQGTLICYLRVCPDLPDPPPVGCIVLQRHQVCCPELICTESRKGGNRIESRAELDVSLLEYNKSAIGEGCISNGTIYAEGSAMLSSSECEHCFCLAGQMNCIKPKCLLPLKGCEPIYEKNSCCPIRYDCSKKNETISTTETHQKQVCYSNGTIFDEGEKIVVPGHSNCDNCYCFDGKIHCEHLSCAPTLLGCEPIIPPEKCCATSYNCSGTIEVKPNGFYSKNPPDVSKNYAKLRKEQHVKYSSNELNRNVITTEKNWSKTVRSPSVYEILNEKHATTYNSIIDGRNNRRIDRPNNQTNQISNHINEEVSTTTIEDLSTILSTVETEQPTTETILESTTINEITTASEENTTILTTTDPNLATTTTNTFENNETKFDSHENMKYKSKTEIITVENCNITNDSSIMPSNSTIIYTKTVVTTNFSNGSNKIKNYTVENSTHTAENVSTNKIKNTHTAINVLTNKFKNNHTAVNVTTNKNTQKEVNVSTNKIKNTHNAVNVTTNKIKNTNNTETISTNKIKNQTLTRNSSIENYDEQTEHQISNNETITTNNNSIENRIDNDQLLEITSEVTDAITDELLKNASLKEINIEDNSNDDYINNTKDINSNTSSMKTISEDIEAILNITKIKNHEFDDYDYNEPSLPPSLPNLKIIPFVAADAVDETIDTAAFSNLAKDKILASEHPIFRYDSQSLNLFSPPIETEGGFLPRNPPITDSFYENSYHTTNIVDITSVTPAPSITNPPKLNENCFSKGREYKHGELLSAPDSCVLCMCFFGDIVCQQPKCPSLKPGCTRLPVTDTLSCCGHIICDNEAPTVVLDRMDVTSNPQNKITIANQITTPDPFRDVIRTEPAPDLQSLIGDIIPFLKSQQTTTALTSTMASFTTSIILPLENNRNETVNSTISSTTDLPVIQITTNKPNIQTSEDSPKINLPTKDDTDDFSFDKVLELLFASETTTKKSITTIKSDTSTDINLIESRIVNNNFDNHINYLPLKFPSTIEDKISLSYEPNSTLNSNITTTDPSITTPLTTQAVETTTEKQTLPNLQYNIHHNNLDAIQNGVGLLKLAGCNIYGRMYRVGRIISELSGPCLECMCTDIGVQCRPLKC